MKENISKKPNKKLYSVLVTVLFFAILVLFFILGIVFPDSTYSETENRNLAAFPKLTFTSVTDGSFMTAFEDYMSDQFPFRNTAVSAKTAGMRLLGKTEVNGVYIGKNGRLFEVQSEYEEKKLSETANAVNSFALECGINEQYFILVPNSTCIIDASLPPFLECDDQAMQITNFYGTLSSDIITVDTVSPLKMYPDKNDLYFRTDHHWTSAAALEVFMKFSETAGITADRSDYKSFTVSNSFSGTLASSSGIYETTDTLSVTVPENSEGTYVVNNVEQQMKTSSVFDLSKLETKNQYEVFFGGNFSRIEINTKTLNGKKLLIFKDSYANCFIPLLTPHFEKIVIIDPRYFTEDINDIISDTSFTHLIYLYNVNTLLEDSVLADTLNVQ